MTDRIEKLIKLLPTKIEEGLKKLEELPIESEDFTRCLANTFQCMDLDNKLSYKPETNKEDRDDVANN
jgi:hypothetical protein